MENFKHLPEPFRIRVIEPVKRTTRAYREEAIIKSRSEEHTSELQSHSDLCEYYICNIH